MKRQKGQALVEFILILPILLFLMMTIFDIGTIMYEKYKLNQILDTASDIFSNQGTDEAINYAIKNKVKFDYQIQDGNYILTISKNIKITTPVFNKILGNPYQIKEEKMIIPYEKKEVTNE